MHSHTPDKDQSILAVNNYLACYLTNVEKRIGREGRETTLTKSLGASSRFNSENPRHQCQ
jgi:hypothetical protein